MKHAGLIDWPHIRTEYEENRASVRALARRYCISDTAIHKRAAAEKWPRKPAPDQVRHGSPSASTIPAISGAQEDRNAADGLQSPSPTTPVMLTSAQLVRRGRAVIENLLRELADSADHIVEIEEEIIKETSQDADGRRRQAMLRAISLASRSLVTKNLAQAIKALSYRSAPNRLGKKEQQRRDAQFLASNGRFTKRRLPPRHYNEDAG